jgi:hypothetical protein
MLRLRDIFLLSQVAEITGLPFYKAKKWTAGQPITIRPFLPSSAAGLHSLFNGEDICLFMLAAKLEAFEIRQTRIAKIIEKLQAQLEMAGPDSGATPETPKWLVVTADGEEVALRLLDRDVSPIDWGDCEVTAIVDLQRIIEDARARIESYYQTGGRRRVYRGA